MNYNIDKGIGIICPCKECNDRVLNCHSTCKAYNKYTFCMNYYKNKIRHTKEKLGISHTSGRRTSVSGNSLPNYDYSMGNR